jgi:hypothetical protein
MGLRHRRRRLSQAEAVEEEHLICNYLRICSR